MAMTMGGAKNPQMSAEWMLANGYVPHDAQGNLLASWDANTASGQDYAERTGSGDSESYGEVVAGSGAARRQAAIADLQRIIDSGGAAGVTAFNPSGKAGNVNHFNRYAAGPDGSLTSGESLKQYERSAWTGFRDDVVKPGAAMVAAAYGMYGPEGGFGSLFGAGGAGGAGSAAPAGLDAATWATMGGGGGATASQALTPALMESALGTAGYGASSAGAGGSVLAAGAPGSAWMGASGDALASAGDAAPSFLSGLADKVPGFASKGLEMALKNPQAIAALLGGVAGVAGSKQGESTPESYGPAVQWNTGIQQGIQPGQQRLASSMFRGLGMGK